MVSANQTSHNAFYYRYNGKFYRRMEFKVSIICKDDGMQMQNSKCITFEIITFYLKFYLFLSAVIKDLLRQSYRGRNTPSPRLRSAKRGVAQLVVPSTRDSGT
jgi:hypothetical protein